MTTKTTLKNRIFSFLLALTLLIGLLPLASIRVSAANETTYITSIAVAENNDLFNTEEKALNKLKNNGYTVCSLNLNDNAGHAKIFLGYKTSTSYQNAITGIIVRSGKNPPESTTYRGSTFYLLGGNSEYNGSGNGVVDLNYKSGGDYLYIYITRDRNYGSPLTHVSTLAVTTTPNTFYATDTSGNVVNVNKNDHSEASPRYIGYETYQNNTTASKRMACSYYLNSKGKVERKVFQTNVSWPDETWNVPVSNPSEVTCDGYRWKFAGWTVNNLPVETRYVPQRDKAIYTQSDIPQSGNTDNFVSYYAVYSSTVTLTYDSNGGTGTPAAQSATVTGGVGTAKFTHYSTSFTITSETPVNSAKCKLIGWSTDKNATTAQYKAGDKVEFKQNTTLYAVYATQHSYSDKWSSDGTYHWHDSTCGCDKISNKGTHNYSAATCTTPKTCKTCGYQTGGTAAHSYEYIASGGNTITEKCKTCDHIASATITAEKGLFYPYTYTGSPIEPLTVAYSDNWKGGTLDIVYTDNINVGRASGSITKNGKTATEGFFITNATMTGVTAESYSNAYDGLPHGITVHAPDGATVTYSTDGKTYSTIAPTYTEKGSYTVYYKVQKDNYDPVTGSATVTISQSENSWITEPSIVGWTYGEQENAPSVGEPKFGDEVQVAYKAAGANDGEYTTEVPTQAGNYIACFTVDGNENYASLSKEVAFTIERAKLTVKANDDSKTYGENDPIFTWSITDGGLVGEDELTDITVSRTEGEDAQTYVLTAGQAKNANPNYLITFTEGTFTIGKKTIGIEWGNTLFTYDGTEQCPTATAIDTEFGDEIGLRVEGKQKNAGMDYIATVTEITGDKAMNYELPVDVTTNFVIYKAEQSAPEGITCDSETIEGKADGHIYNLTAAMEYCKDDELEFTPITGTELTNLAEGIYYIRYREDNNHNASPETPVVIDSGRKLDVTIPNEQTGYTLTVDKYQLAWHEELKLTFTLHEGYSRLDSFAVQINGEPITLDENGKCAFTSAETDITVTVVGVADITAPTGKIILGTHAWDAFCEDITDSLFYSDTQTVEITGSDEGSGLDQIFYYTTDTPMSLEELQSEAFTEWWPCGASFSVYPNGEFILYVKLVDYDGNATYLSSEKIIVLDCQQPIINGIYDGMNEYGDTTFTVDEQYLDTVTVDGEPVKLTDGSYTLIADGKEHTVIATDKAGNESDVVTVTLIAISSIDDKIEHLTEDNVNWDHYQDIYDVLETIRLVIEHGKEYTETENTQLADMKENAEKLKTLLEAVSAEIEDINEKANGYLEESVKSTDEQDIRELLDRIDTLLDGNNLTEDERTFMEGTKEYLNGMLEKIDQTAKEVQDLTDKVDSYDPDKVTSEDREDIENILNDINGLLDGDNLTESEKEAFGEVRENAENLLDKIEQAGSAGETENTDKVKDTTAETVTPEEKEDLEQAKDDLEKVLDDYKDNLTEDEKKDIQEEIDRIQEALDAIENVEKVEDLINKLPENITKEDSGKIQEAENAYNGLTEHEKTMVDEKAKDKLDNAKAALDKLLNPGKTPGTGDESAAWLWLGLLLLSATALIAILALGKKKKENR